MLAAYEDARKWAVANPAELKALLAKAAKLPDDVVARQLERTDLSFGPIGAAQAETITAAGEALVEAGVFPAGTDVKKTVGELIDPSFGAKLTN